jgi:hypothetical protein
MLQNAAIPAAVRRIGDDTVRLWALLGALRTAVGRRPLQLGTAGVRGP